MKEEEVLLLFPAAVFRFRNLGLDDGALLRAIMEGEGSDFFRHESPGNYTSEDYNLQRKPALAPLVEAVESRAHQAFTEYFRYEYEELYVNTMWCNVQQPDPHASHHWHHHANSFFSGTYYAEISDDRSPIIFESPHPPKLVKPKTDRWNPLNADTYPVPVRTGDLLLWPSELRHSVPTYQSARRRVSISFNIMFRGRLGGPGWEHVY